MAFTGICRPNHLMRVPHCIRAPPISRLVSAFVRKRRRRHELVLSYTDRGLRCTRMRSPTWPRLYLQLRPEEDIENWSTTAFGDECTNVLAEPRAQGRQDAAEGHHPMRRFVVERCNTAACSLRVTAPYRAADRREGHELSPCDVMRLSRALMPSTKKTRR